MLPIFSPTPFSVRCMVESAGPLRALLPFPSFFTLTLLLFLLRRPARPPARPPAHIMQQPFCNATWTDIVIAYQGTATIDAPTAVAQMSALVRYIAPLAAAGSGSRIGLVSNVRHGERAPVGLPVAAGTDVDTVVAALHRLLGGAPHNQQIGESMRQAGVALPATEPPLWECVMRRRSIGAVRRRVGTDDVGLASADDPLHTITTELSCTCAG